MGCQYNDESAACTGAENSSAQAGDAGAIEGSACGSLTCTATSAVHRTDGWRRVAAGPGDEAMGDSGRAGCTGGRGGPPATTAHHVANEHTRPQQQESPCRQKVALPARWC